MELVPAYAELHCLSNFSFLRGASHPEELVERAAAQGYAALALTDECSVAGVVRAHMAARERGLALIIGTELTLRDGTKLVLHATDRASYGDLAQLITRGRRNAAKGRYALTRDDVAALLLGLIEDVADAFQQRVAPVLLEDLLEPASPMPRTSPPADGCMKPSVTAGGLPPSCSPAPAIARGWHA